MDVHAKYGESEPVSQVPEPMATDFEESRYAPRDVTEGTRSEERALYAFRRLPEAVLPDKEESASQEFTIAFTISETLDDGE